MEEYSEIIKSHPGIVLTSDNPKTWKGFLIVDPNFGFNVDIKLVVPNYPELKDAELLFGESISLLFGTGFDEKIEKLLERATTVSSLLLRLKRLVTNLLEAKFGISTRNTNLQEGIIEELNNVLRADSPVKISANSGLNAVKLSLDKVNVTMRKDTATNTWKVISSDLPKLSWLENFESNIQHLSEAMNKLQTQVEILQDTWNQLSEIDETCWVIDPPNPKPYHLYRTIKLTPSLSAMITINPIAVQELPEVKLLGSDRDVAKYRNIMNSQLDSWDPECSIVENLRILLAIDQLPQPPEIEEIRDKNAIVEDDECCICFDMELDGKFPVEICNNEKCRRHFHTYCLMRCLQSIPSNQVSFNRIHGNCPNCDESISCSVITS